MEKNANVMNARFTLDFFKKTITGTPASFNKASKGSGPIYEELAAKIAAHPDFTLAIDESKSNSKSNKERQVYKGMDIAFMRDYLAATKDTDFSEKFDKIISFAKKNGRNAYPFAKKHFLKYYTLGETVMFNYDEAKKLVEHYRIYQKNPIKITSNSSVSKKNQNETGITEIAG